LLIIYCTPEVHTTVRLILVVYRSIWQDPMHRKVTDYTKPERDTQTYPRRANRRRRPVQIATVLESAEQAFDLQDRTYKAKKDPGPFLPRASLRWPYSMGLIFGPKSPEVLLLANALQLIPLRSQLRLYGGSTVLAFIVHPRRISD
jgi:hypothetical protein